jgi:hypothetical protein
MKQCPVCRSTNVRRSGCSHEETSTHAFQSPYRCQECNTRFWVLSRKTRIGAFVVGALSTVLLLVVGGTLLHGSDSPGAVAAGSNVPIDGISMSSSTSLPDVSITPTGNN